jgi:hypothetical protein
MATVTKTTTAIVEGNIYSAGAVHWSDIEDMDTCGSGAGNASGAVTGWLYTPICTDFDFALAPTDVITKIEVLITGDENGTSYLDYCSLLYNGTPSPVHCFAYDAVNPLDGTSHVLTFQPIGSGDPDMWGVAWTPAMVNDISFGCAFDGMHETGDTINIDCVRITITYTPNGETPTGICDGIPCDERMELNDAIIALVTKFTMGGERPFECFGLKGAPRLMKCTDLTDLSTCGVNYTFEQAIKASLTNDGCGSWAIRVFVLPPNFGGQT